MMELADFLRNIGVTPISALMVALSVWATSQYFKYKIESERDKDKQALDFLAEMMKKRAAMLEELNGHVHDFDHYVSHVFEGDAGWYITAINDKYKIIRTLSREKIELIEDDFPEFLELIYIFTDEGILIIKKQFDFNRYEKSKKDLKLLFSHIRATLPGRRQKISIT